MVEEATSSKKHNKCGSMNGNGACNKGRKSKKQSEKEVIRAFLSNDGIEPHAWVFGGNNNNNNEIGSNNMQYYSITERKKFEQSFCAPKNDRQHKLQKCLNNPQKKIVIATGPAGTGKTLFATQTAIRLFLLGVFEKIVFTRPSVTVDEELGFLPGSLEEKMAPWMRPIYDILHAHISPKEVANLLEDKSIEIAPLGFMRGRTFKNCCIVADEAQNCTPSQMMMLLTRIGEGSRLFITGDLEQCDLAKDATNGLDDFLSRFRNRRSDSISSIEFCTGDVEREAVVKEVLEIYASDQLDIFDSTRKEDFDQEQGLDNLD